MKNVKRSVGIAMFFLVTSQVCYIVDLDCLIGAFSFSFALISQASFLPFHLDYCEFIFHAL